MLIDELVDINMNNFRIGGERIIFQLDPSTFVDELINVKKTQRINR